jgi:hypothetical protein
MTKNNTLIEQLSPCLESSLKLRNEDDIETMIFDNNYNLVI